MNRLLKKMLMLIFLCVLYPISAQSIKDELIKGKYLFADSLYSELSMKKKRIKLDKIENPVVKILLEQLVDGSFNRAYRVQSYKNYLSPFVLAKELKTGVYSQFENPTGIYFTEGEEIALIVERDVENLKLRITEFGPKGGDSTYTLGKGINVIMPQNSGNGYICFFSESRDQLQDNVKIHIVGGQLTGYYDVKKSKQEDWKSMLDAEGSPVLDIVGSRVHLIFPKKGLKEFAPVDGAKLIATYDSIIYLQHEIMGLNKYNRVPENHILGRVIWKGYMHADQYGAAFHDDTMGWIADVGKLKSDPWAVAHEFGHVNQVRPWMRWTGTTEVTNNIFSAWTRYLFNSQNPQLEKELKEDYHGEIIGGRITSYMEGAFIKKYQWLTQPGPDRWDRKNARDWGGDHFVKLVPLWQLQLYHTVAGEGNSWYNPDFYADIYIQAINNEKEPKDAGEAQLNFVRKACEVTKTDLTDFFEQSGILLPIDLWVDDYTCSQMTITEDDIADVKRFASKYNKPVSPVIHYITTNSVDYFMEQLPIEGQLNVGVTLEQDVLTVDHKQWKNVVAFETYKGDELIRISFGGAGSFENDFTIVRFPEGATHVEAVAWDGERKTVYKI